MSNKVVFFLLRKSVTQGEIRFSRLIYTNFNHKTCKNPLKSVKIMLKARAINATCGIVIGMIFTQAYNLILGKEIKKGLYYGLIIAVISSLHTVAYYIGWWTVLGGLWAFVVGFFSTAITLGIVLETLHKN